MAKILSWLRDHEPVWCYRCNNLHWKKDITYVEVTTGEFVPLCKECFRDVYSPWAGGLK